MSINPAAAQKAISRPMESQGFHSQLARLYEYEAKAEHFTPDCIGFKYARTLYVTGRLRDALSEYDKLFHRMVDQKSGRDDGLFISVLRSTAELLIDVSHAELALQVLDGSLESAEIAELPATVGIQTVSVLTWALMKFGRPSECIEVNDEVLDARFGGLAPPFSKAISHIRVGAALHALGRFEEAISSLESANEFFESRDTRAFAWSSLHLALSYRSVGRSEDAEASLLRAIETRSCPQLRRKVMARSWRAARKLRAVLS